MNANQPIDRGPLIILGASARAAAQSAIRSGFRPSAIDLFADLDLQRIAPAVQIERYPAEFLSALSAAPQAPWIYTGSLENYPRLVARLAKLRPLAGNGPEVLRKVRDPRWLGELLADSPVRYPETVVGDRSWGAEVRSQRTGVRNQESGNQEDWLLKPLRSGGGMGILRVNLSVNLDLRHLTPDSRSLTPDFCLQRCVAGQSISASFVATGGEVQWIGATEQWIGSKWGAPQEFQYAGSLAPLVLTATEQAALLDVARLLANVAGLRGLFGLDLMRNEQGLWLIEVNPRYTASMELLERLTGRQLIAEHFGISGNDAPQGGRCSRRGADLQNDIDPQLAAKLIIYTQTAGSAGKSLYETLHALSQAGLESADVPRLGTAFQAGNPICTLITDGNSRDEIATKLVSAGEVVRKSLDL